jgi:hypothetical protein
MKKFDWKYLVLFVLAIPVVNQLASYLGTSAAQHVNEREAVSRSAQAADRNIRVIASSQDAQGVTQKNFIMSFLWNLEAYTVERIKTKIRELPNSPQVDITSEANYVESGPMKLAVIRIRGSDNSNQIFIHGIVGNELKRVACFRNSTEAIPISYGVCADKINEVFGAKIGG